MPNCLDVCFAPIDRKRIHLKHREKVILIRETAAKQKNDFHNQCYHFHPYKKRKTNLQLQDHNNVNDCFSGEQERAWESSRATLFTCQRARRGDNDDDVDCNDDDDVNDDNTTNFYQFDDDNGKRFNFIMMT